MMKPLRWLKYLVEGMDQPCWRPVNKTSRVKTPAKKNSSYMNGPSLGIHFRVLCNRMFFYRTKLGMTVDHQLIVVLYNKNSKSHPFCVSKHQSVNFWHSTSLYHINRNTGTPLMSSQGINQIIRVIQRRKRLHLRLRMRMTRWRWLSGGFTNWQMQ